jgi:hypothetical protein
LKLAQRGRLFGPEAVGLQQRSSELERWADRVIDAESLEQVFAAS